MIDYSYYNSKIGIVKIGECGGAVCEIKITDRSGESAPSALSDTAFAQIAQYLDGKRKSFNFPTVMKGTEFQNRVWSMLCDIPYGETRTYGEIAALLGNPKAARAVGSACNRNPLLIIVPCHRVLGANGSLTGFAAGIKIKKYLTELEKTHRRPF